MISISFDFIKSIIEVFIDDFTVYGYSFDNCFSGLALMLERCIETNLILNQEKYHFMLDQGIILGHVTSSMEIEVDKSKIDVIHFLPYLYYVREVHSFLCH